MHMLSQQHTPEYSDSQQIAATNDVVQQGEKEQEGEHGHGGVIHVPRQVDVHPLHRNARRELRHRHQHRRSAASHSS